jgi:aminopeptidase-like protein
LGINLALKGKEKWQFGLNTVTSVLKISFGIDMALSGNKENSNINLIGEEILVLMNRLFPICRSITGRGVRETLQILGKHIPLEIHEVPTGTKVFDWTVPKEWNIKDAYVKNSKGEKLIDFQKSNLHVLNYSIPVKKILRLNELKEHLFTLPDHPEWIPYKTSYYKENWGFCLSHNQLMALEDGDYEVCIDSTLTDGELTYGEYVIPGESKDEILVSTHICHPSLANDNLSGVCTAIFLAKRLAGRERRYTYRFLFIPGTIGAITWLALSEEQTAKIKHGLVITGIGDSGKITYKKSRRGNAEIDKAAFHVLKHSGQPFRIIDFDPYGYDERQYCSPGFDLPVGRLSRTPYAEYPEYHTSADNLNFVKKESLADSFEKILSILNVLESDGTYVNLNPMCEPQLGKRGLYDQIGPNELAMLWVLNQSDGSNSLLDIAERSGTPFEAILQSATLLESRGLLDKCMMDPLQATSNQQAANTRRSGP